MKTRPDESPLLDDVLAESVPAPDSLETLLRAVRTRRRRANAGPVAAAIAVALVAWFGSRIWDPRNPAESSSTSLAHVSPTRSRLEPVVERICELWLALHGYDRRVTVDWEDINLQDLVEEARAELYREQAEELRLAREGKEG